MPFARATGIGSTFDCAVHSKSVCFFDSAIISSPLIVDKVSTVIRTSLPFAPLDLLVPSADPDLPASKHRVPLRLELVARLPVRKLVRLRDAVADREQHLQIFARPFEVPL